MNINGILKLYPVVQCRKLCTVKYIFYKLLPFPRYWFRFWTLALDQRGLKKRNSHKLVYLKHSINKTCKRNSFVGFGALELERGLICLKHWENWHTTFFGQKITIWLLAFTTNQLGLSVKKSRSKFVTKLFALNRKHTFSPSESCGRSSGAQGKNQKHNLGETQSRLNPISPIYRPSPLQISLDGSQGSWRLESTSLQTKPETFK